MPAIALASPKVAGRARASFSSSSALRLGSVARSYARLVGMRTSAPRLAEGDSAAAGGLTLSFTAPNESLYDGAQVCAQPPASTAARAHAAAAWRRRRRAPL